jgi:hypothetical protein
MTLTILELDDDLLADECLEEGVEEHGRLPRACPLGCCSCCRARALSVERRESANARCERAVNENKHMYMY